MKISEFIRTQVFAPRLERATMLVVYDPDQRYREICLALATNDVRVTDASESSIESREEALATLQLLGEPNASVKSLLIYVPSARPITDEDLQRDPFAIYGACGAVFPEGDGDEYLSLCLMARADHTTNIRRIFQQDPNPSFAMIDAVGAGTGWPILQATLGVESAREILFALLVPEPWQQTALKGDSWLSEAKQLLLNALGLRLTTRGKSWDAVADEFWRYLLFSEFAFDLPVPLPSALLDVPRALTEARPLIEGLCQQLRNDLRTRALYISRAEEIEAALGLQAACAAITDLGVRDTFPFEERSYFNQAVDALQRDSVDRLRQLLGRHDQSVWIGRAENQVQWQVLHAAARLNEACEDASRQLAEHARSQETLIDFYLASLRETDRLQREFEEVASDYLGGDALLGPVIDQARAAYSRLTGKAQEVFVRHLEDAGWPPAGRQANADTFDRILIPLLQESGRRVALILIDALRYELGVELQRRLADDVQAELQAAFAQLPSVTPVGMASLLPGAGQQLRLTRKGDDIVPMLGDQVLGNVTQRLDVLRRRFGQRLHDATLGEFLRGNVGLPGTVELLVLRSNELDSNFESNPETAPGLISRTFQQVVAAIRRLRELGFQDAVIATDHGFFLNAVPQAGDVCTKPPGSWIAIHDRLLLGDGSGDAANLVLPASTLGIRGDFTQVALPRALVTYRAGQSYFHGGVSLQEAIVPVIVSRLTAIEPTLAKTPSVILRYKRDARKITTRLPVIEVVIGAGDLFSQHNTFDIILEAQDRQGNVVGEARPGGPVNPATKTIAVIPGNTIPVTMRMILDFEGKFSIKALDPTTQTTYSKLDLETDYTV